MAADEELLRQWVFEYSKPLLRIAHAHTGNWAVAEDAVQNAFVKASRNLGSLRNPDAAFAWLVRITINECRTIGRRKVWEIPNDDPPQGVSGSPEDTLLHQAALASVHRAVVALPDKYRTPIVLFYFEDMSISDIATALEMSPQTVKTRLKRGRERLARVLQEVGKSGLGGTASQGSGLL